MEAREKVGDRVAARRGEEILQLKPIRKLHRRGKIQLEKSVEPGRIRHHSATREVYSQGPAGLHASTLRILLSPGASHAGRRWQRLREKAA
jgi:hypothetical protein